MNRLKGKKLLVIGGSFQHVKLVEAANKMGVITYVTDYFPYEKAPAKQIAHKYFMYNIYDIDDIVDMCKREGIDGVLSTSLDACQKPYYEICRRLNLPCFGKFEQFNILTDKSEFKKFCALSGVDTIPEYDVSDFETEEVACKKVAFPVLIKPCESRGSRGQTICNTYAETKDAIQFAKKESSNGRIIIEKYMGQANDFSMTILVINKKAYPIRTVDRILGKYEDGLDKLAVGSASPSVFTDVYLTKAHKKVEKFIEAIGLVNAPIFMQGFVDGDTVRFYDPGLRLPGGEYERMFESVFGRNPMEPLIEFALTGKVEKVDFRPDDVYLNGKLLAQVLPTLKAGTIKSITGLEEIKNHKNVVSVFERFSVGDTIVETRNVNQRFCEIDIVCDNEEQTTEVVAWVYKTLRIEDENGQNMIISSFDPNYYVNRKNILKGVI